MTKPLALVVGSINDIAPVKYLINSLQSLGWDTFVVSDRKSPLANVHKYGGANIAKILKEHQLNPSLFLFVEGGEMQIFPTHFDELTCPTMWWGIDTHNDYLKHLRISALFDHSFIAQKSFVQQLQQDGIRSVSWLPLASPIASEQTFNRIHDVSYVGSTNWTLYPQRGELLKAIVENFENCVIGPKSAAEMLHIYLQSKIVFNNSLKNDINMRIFEAMGAGALLITNPIIDNGIEELFVEGADYVTYLDVEELCTKIDHLLVNGDELSQIAISGMAKVHRLHTYDARAKEIAEFALNGAPKLTYNAVQESAALLSMGLYSNALESLSRALRREAGGTRRKTTYLVTAPIIRLAIIIANGVEKVFLARRLFS